MMYERLALGMSRFVNTERSHTCPAGLRHERQEATRYVDFIDGHGTGLPHFDQTSLYLELRYAPGAEFKPVDIRYVVQQGTIEPVCEFRRHAGDFDQTSLYLELRYAPGEKFYQGNSSRVDINHDAPVFRLSAGHH